MRLFPPYNHPDAVCGLEQFSHIWLIFIFHQTMTEGWRPLVRPPCLGGNTKRVFSPLVLHFVLI
ncbi:putative tRNA (adenine(37)-N6)-methyltransferase [Arsenophonus endosymbiont of Bemisia tabaci Q2]|nr:putative tRNA (adenine(37)-N6)-methyltransferase [Arsenophonus endosymbiont of Bemisia tabaci Q2]